MTAAATRIAQGGYAAFVASDSPDDFGVLARALGSLAAAAGVTVRAAIDDGPGVAAEHLPRLFERFYRVDPGRSRERGGTGLGLAIVKHLVESMSGSVTVASAAGEECRFTIDLPAAPPQEPELIRR